MNTTHTALRFVPVLALIVLTAGCASSRLQKNVFEGHTIAATAAFPPEARVRHPLMAASGRHLPGFARDERRRLDRLQNVLKAASTRIDLPARIAADLIETGARELGATITRDPATADYVLDFRVSDYGLMVRSSGTTANFYIDAVATIRDRAKEAVIWKERVDRVSDFRVKLGGDPIADLTEADLEQVLAEFTAYTSERMTKALRKDIKE